MEYRKVAPCFECGARTNEIDDFTKGNHQFYYFPLFDNEIFCDFCINDIESTDPVYWGFSIEFDWKKVDDIQNVTLCDHIDITMEWVCTQCYYTENQQKFVIKNAKKYKQKLPNMYWKYLAEKGSK